MLMMVNHRYKIMMVIIVLLKVRTKTKIVMLWKYFKPFQQEGQGFLLTFD